MDSRPMMGSRHRRNRTWRLLRGISGLGLVALVSTLAADPAGAATAPSGSATGTIGVAVRSVTVSPATFGYARCDLANGTIGTGTLLAFPNGRCVSDAITIVNGTQPGHIFVAGAAALPADGGTPWTLTALKVPGTDQFSEVVQGLTGAGGLVVLTVNPQCDLAFNARNPADPCLALPQQSGQENTVLVGPTVSSDPSTTFHTTITWTAVP